MINVGTEVKVQKIGVADDPNAKTPASEEYAVGESNSDVSLPTEYEVEGKLIAEIEEGVMLTVKRKKRNGIEEPGFLQTTPIESVDRSENEVVVETRNSIYRITKTDL